LKYVKGYNSTTTFASHRSMSVSQNIRYWFSFSACWSTTKVWRETKLQGWPTHSRICVIQWL